MGRNKKNRTARSDTTEKSTPVVEENVVHSGDDSLPRKSHDNPVTLSAKDAPPTDEGCDDGDDDLLLGSSESPVDGGDNLEETVDILGSGQLIKKVIDRGLGRETRPSHGDAVEISYKGWLEDGTLVEDVSSVSFTLGDGDVIQALDLAVPLAECKECFELVVDPRFAFGSRGRDPDVPSDSKLRYMVTVLSVSDPPNYSTMDNRERVKRADMKRERGNYYFKREEYAFAVNSYNKALIILTTPFDGNHVPPADTTEGSNEAAVTQELVEDLEIRLENNLAAAQLKIQAYDAAIRSCDNVLRKDPRNFKALFRKGKSLLEQAELDQAIPILKTVQDMVPNSPTVNAELQRARLMRQQERERWSRATRRMFPEMAKQPKGASLSTCGRVHALLFSRRMMLLFAILFALASIGLAWFFEAVPSNWIPSNWQ